MKALEIENILKFINAKIQIMNAKAPLMQTGVDTSERDQIEKKLDQLFNIDDKHIGLKSNVDKFEEKMGQITQLIDQISVGTNPLLPEQL
jgi:hypothetical protein